MKTNYIYAPANSTYVSEFMTKLPSGIFNKKETGCGATHLALTNSLNTIVAVPTIELIKNKMAQLNGLFGVYSGVDQYTFNTHVKNQLNNNQAIKLMVTYDSLPKMIKWLESFKELNPGDFKIVIDEYHLLLSAYSYRDKAIRNLLKLTSELGKEFDNITYLSATPLDAEYTPTELVNVQTTELIWGNVVKVRPCRMKCNKPLNGIKNIIQDHLVNTYTQIGEGKAKELYIFLNSVNAIKDIIDDLNLDNSQVKVVCSDTNANKEKLDTIKISSALDVNKPITFITSKAFMGADFYSTSGLIIIVSCNNKKSTMLDIATDITQISGRIRNKDNEFKNMILHIYNTGTSEMTREEWESEMNNRKMNSLIQIQSYNEMSDTVRAAWRLNVEMELEERYIYVNENDMLAFDEFKMKSQDFNFKIVNEVYTNGLSIREAYANNGFDVKAAQIFVNLEEGTLLNKTSRSFKDIAKKYIDLQNGEYNEEIRVKIANLEREEPLLKQVYVKLGLGAFETHKFNQTSLKEALYAVSDEVNNALASILNGHFKSNVFYKLADIKEFLKEQYETLKLKKTAKATDLEQWFEVSFESKRIDGNKVGGLTIIRSKYKEVKLNSNVQCMF